MTLPYHKVIKMAVLRRRNLGYLLTNFANTLINPASNLFKTQKALFHCSSLLFGKGQEIKMPSLSPTMQEGKIVKWLKKEGDPINPGDILCDIETDKAIVSMETEEEGILAKILIPENTPNIKIGSLIALMVAQGEDWKNVEVSASSSNSSTSEPDGKDVEPVTSGPSSIPIQMPSLSPTMTEGTIVKWLKKEGDAIKPGDVLCDIQTDKAVMSLEAEEEGIMAKILAPDDTKNVKIGTMIAVMVEEGEDWKSVVLPSIPKSDKEAISQSKESSTTGGAVEVGGKKFGPAVKALLAEYQIESGLIKPSGKGNRLLKEDVLKYIEDNNLQKKPPKIVSPPSAVAKSIEKQPEKIKKTPKAASPAVSKYKDIETSGMRQTIARRLMESKSQIPHFYSSIKCDVDNLIKKKDDLSSEGFKVSLNDLLTKALALTLQMYPKANAIYVDNEIRVSRNVDVCVAVATNDGLYTPIIKSSNQKSVISISQEIKELAGKAREGKLKPEEYQGGTFTISNLGMFGVKFFKAVINPPQCGILAVGSTTESLSPELKKRNHIIVNMSSDRRILEEHEAAEFMEILKYLIENPNLIASDINHSLSMRL